MTVPKTMPPETTDRLFTVQGVAHRLRVSTKTVRRWVASRELPAHRLGRQLRISEQDLRRFLRDRWLG